MLCTAQAAMRLHLARVYCSIEAYLLVLAAALPVGRLNHKLHREDVSQLGTIAIPSTCDLRQRYTLSAESRGSWPSRMLCSAQACPTVRPECAAPGVSKVAQGLPHLLLCIVVVGAGQQVPEDELRHVHLLLLVHLHWHSITIVPHADSVCSLQQKQCFQQKQCIQEMRSGWTPQRLGAEICCGQPTCCAGAGLLQVCKC